MRKKILLVDDSRTSLLLQKMMLRDAVVELEFYTASNGRMAVDVAIQEQPDVVLMDVMMPEMNGFEAVRAIRSTPELADVPIIMMTTRGESVNLAEGFAAGCNEYLIKPFSAADLLEKVETALGVAERWST